ncbi:hypothetical protein QQ008_03750 [Fulvivirgaceae bacterium BMA10]|uniref:Anti-sigma factor n=1 Tax=Splendidivirga corallicola TaxID=3051826 RepID=A0ABT8KJL4_9BACT|nr:hypothetical protein [Fulvivirgaceae bacterium BMA10]
MELRKMAKIKRIEILLDKYWKGESSIDQEKELRAFFSTEEVPDHLASFAPLFQYFDKQGSKDFLDKDFEEGVLNTLTDSEGKMDSGERFNLFRNVAKIAAAFIVIVVTVYFFNRDRFETSSNDLVLKGSIENPEMAYDEVKKALVLISSKINKGKDQVKELSKMNKAAALFNKQNKENNK